MIEPVVADAGCELVDVLVARGHVPWTLRVTVDTPQCDGRVLVDRCAAISREIGSQLDVADAIEAPYRLEVSSPGLDRLLAREKDFAAACGKEVKLKTRRPVGGRRRFKGRLLDFSGGMVLLKVDGQDFEIPFAQIERANSMYQFSRADFASEKSSDAAH